MTLKTRKNYAVHIIYFYQCHRQIGSTEFLEKS